MSLTDPTYLALIASADAPGVVGHPDARAANARRAAIQGASRIQAPRWTIRRLDHWRAQSVDRLDTALLQPAAPLDHPIERARAVLALADTAVRDAWLVRYGHADPETRSRAADRLADLAADAPADYRAPVGTVLALTEWTQGRPEAGAHLADATRDLREPYTLAALLEGMIRAEVHPREFMTTVLGALTEADCLAPDRLRQRTAHQAATAAVHDRPRLGPPLRAPQSPRPHPGLERHPHPPRRPRCPRSRTGRRQRRPRALAPRLHRPGPLGTRPQVPRHHSRRRSGRPGPTRHCDPRPARPGPTPRTRPRPRGLRPPVTTPTSTPE